MFIQAYREWIAGNLTATAAMKQIGMKKPTFYRRVKEYEQQRIILSSRRGLIKGVIREPDRVNWVPFFFSQAAMLRHS